VYKTCTRCVQEIFLYPICMDFILNVNVFFFDRFTQEGERRIELVVRKIKSLKRNKQKSN